MAKFRVSTYDHEPRGNGDYMAIHKDGIHFAALTQLRGERPHVFSDSGWFTISTAEFAKVVDVMEAVRDKQHRG